MDVLRGPQEIFRVEFTSCSFKQNETKPNYDDDLCIISINDRSYVSSIRSRIAAETYSRLDGLMAED